MTAPPSRWSAEPNRARSLGFARDDGALHRAAGAGVGELVQTSGDREERDEDDAGLVKMRAFADSLAFRARIQAIVTTPDSGLRNYFKHAPDDRITLGNDAGAIRKENVSENMLHCANRV